VADQAIDLIREALQHPLLGDYAAYFGSASGGGSTTVWSDQGLVSYTGDTRWRNYNAYFPNYSYQDRERRVYSSALNMGQLQIMQPLAAAPASGAEFWLIRDLGWSRLLDFLNQTVRAIWFDREIYLRCQTNQYRYSLPTPISQGNWIEQVYLANQPGFQFSNTQPPQLEWFRVNPLNIVGDLYLVLSEASLPPNANYNLVFACRAPYSQVGSAYSMSRSVLTPFGSTQAVSPPRDVVVAGLVWRILRQKVRNLTGDAKAIWEDALKDAAQEYAQKIAPHGPRLVGVTLGYSVEW
jgi:hypothetical protein